MVARNAILARNARLTREEPGQAEPDVMNSGEVVQTSPPTALLRLQEAPAQESIMNNWPQASSLVADADDLTMSDWGCLLCWLCVSGCCACKAYDNNRRNGIDDLDCPGWKVCEYVLICVVPPAAGCYIGKVIQVGRIVNPCVAVGYMTAQDATPSLADGSDSSSKETDATNDLSK